MGSLTGVGGTFCAAHYSPEGILHGHSYEVWAYFTSGDARGHQKVLRDLLELLDHSTLLHELSWGEPMAEHICTTLGAVKVRVKRPLEMIEAEWTCDSGRHAQRGDPSGAPSEGCQSGGATSAASPTP